MVPYEMSDMQRYVPLIELARQLPASRLPAPPARARRPRHHADMRAVPSCSVAFALITFHFLKREYETVACVFDSLPGLSAVRP